MCVWCWYDVLWLTACFVCLAVGTHKSLPPHCPVSTVQPGIRNITHSQWKCQTCWHCSERIHRLSCLLFFIPSFLLMSINPSTQPYLLSSTIKSTCQCLGLRLEEMRAPSMHHWGTAAGCPNTCQSGEAFLIISHTQLHTHPSSHPHTPHPQACLVTSLKGSQWVSWWPFSVALLFRLLG